MWFGNRFFAETTSHYLLSEDFRVTCDHTTPAELLNVTPAELLHVTRFLDVGLSIYCVKGSGVTKYRKNVIRKVIWHMTHLLFDTWHTSEQSCGCGCSKVMVILKVTKHIVKISHASSQKRSLITWVYGKHDSLHQSPIVESVYEKSSDIRTWIAPFD